MCELGSPQLDGLGSIESLEVINGTVVPEYTRRECSMGHSASYMNAPQPDMQASN